MIVIQVLLCFCYMCVIPYLIGCLFVDGQKDVGNVTILRTVAGLMISYAVYEILEVGFQLKNGNFRLLSLLFILVSVLLAFAGVLRVSYRRLGRRAALQKKGIDFKNIDPFFVIGILLIVIQIFAILWMATPDKDDAFYSGLSSMSLSYDYVLQKDAYNGLMTKAISRRYVLSALPIYQATLSLLSDGLHHLVITHNLFPLFYMPLAYGLYYQLGKRMLQKEGKQQAGGKFLCCLALLHMIGNYYVFSPENFLVTRIWQGKGMFVALGIPYIWYFGCLALEATYEKQVYTRRERLSCWILLAAGMLACSFMGETGLYLAPFLLGCLVLAMSIVYRKWQGILPAALCCLPEAALAVLYLL